MGDHKILQFQWRDVSIDIKVDTNKCTLLDVVVDFEDEAKKRGFRLNYSYPTFGYVYNRNIKREEGEDQKGKRAKTVKYTKCGFYGHNSRTCKGGQTAKEKKANGEPVVIRNPRVRDQSNAAKVAKAAAKTTKTAEKEASQKGTASQKGIASQATEMNISQPGSSHI